MLSRGAGVLLSEAMNGAPQLVAGHHEHADKSATYVLPIVLYGCRSSSRKYRIYNDIGAWRSLVAHLPWAQVVAGSNPAAPTNLIYLSERSYSCRRLDSAFT
jgi:hypothetical protein